MKVQAAVCLIAASFLVSGAAIAQEDSPWMIRLRAIDVVPDESATITPIGGDTKIDNAIVPEVDFTYFFDKNWAAELIVATTRHNVSHTPTGLDLGSVGVLPPTLTLQYHFAPEHRHIRPYVGIGVNYTMFYGSDEPAGLKVSYKNSFGLALQAGVDFPIDDHWSVNVDVKKIYLNTDVKIEPLGVRADVDLDPWVVGVGVGYRF